MILQKVYSPTMERWIERASDISPHYNNSFKKGHLVKAILEPNDLKSRKYICPILPLTLCKGGVYSAILTFLHGGWRRIIFFRLFPDYFQQQQDLMKSQTVTI